jgi:hypothetical protein
VEARLSPAHPRDHSPKVKTFLNASHATLGQSSDRQVELSIGRVPLRLHVSDARMFSEASERYRAFATSQEEPFAIYLRNFFSANGGSAEFSYEFEAHQAALRAFSGESQFVGANNPYTLDCLLRILLTWMLLPRTGFLLHAATVVHDGRAYIFTGRSGAGKSTVASLAPEGTVLTDELSLVRREDGIWRAYGTPFWGEFRAGDSNTSAPIAGIFRLVQAEENRVAPLRPVEFLRAMIGNVLFFSREPADSERLLDIVSQAAQELRGYSLEFRKDRTFWEALPA